ncbi:amidase family protein [Haloplanus sp. GCM10025708]|uniref:amidase family protein n=1 Tax=Haloplanus sp. GCM10025708 TaxID=3252679 RepID=UPI00361FA1C5
MTLRPPTADDVRELGEQLHLDLDESEVEDFRRLVTEGLASYETVRKRAGSTSATISDRSVSGRPSPDSDPLNAWITRCEVSGDADGPLDDTRIGVKDNVAVAGVEMTCGSTVMEGYVPDRDATVVDRLLGAGGRIVGKTNMDDFAFTGNGHSSAFGPTLNPHDPERLAGGSSGGSAIAVATGDVDLAVGCDQGGSVRVPAAWCGVVGHKPTHGLVPYTGIVGIENTIDHVGPIAPDVESAARMLDVVAGKDPADPRQPDSVPVDDYAAALGGDVSDLSVAVVEEGFERPESDEAVNERIREALDALAAAGATVDYVSIPMHHDAVDIYTVALNEGTVAAFRGEGVGHNWEGWYNTSWVQAFGKYRRAQGGDLPPSVKYTLLIGAYTSEAYHSKYYAEAMNLRRDVTDAYDDVLSEYDVIATPTTPQLPHEYTPDQDRFAFLDDAWGVSATPVSSTRPAIPP